MAILEKKNLKLVSRKFQSIQNIRFTANLYEFSVSYISSTDLRKKRQ